MTLSSKARAEFETEVIATVQRSSPLLIGALAALDQGPDRFVDFCAGMSSVLLHFQPSPKNPTRERLTVRVSASGKRGKCSTRSFLEGDSLTVTQVSKWLGLRLKEREEERRKLVQLKKLSTVFVRRIFREYGRGKQISAFVNTRGMIDLSLTDLPEDLALKVCDLVRSYAPSNPKGTFNLWDHLTEESTDT